MIERHSLIVAALFALSLAPRTAAAQGEDSTVILSSRVATNGNFLMLPVRVANEEYLFIVSTGTPRTILDTRLCAQLPRTPVEIPGSPAPNGLSSNFHFPPQMVIAGTELGVIPFPSDSPIASADLSDFREASGSSVKGVLGMDFLQAYVVRFDFSTGILQLLEPSSFHMKDYDGSFQLELSDGIPWLQVDFNGRREQAIVATGALLSCGIQHDLYLKMTERNELEERVVTVDFDNQRRNVRIKEGWLRELRVGPFCHRALLAKRREVNSLGLYYWRRYRCTFDFVAKTVYLQKNKYFDLRDDSDHAGIWISGAVGPGGGRSVQHVAVDSEAYWFGIRARDVLMSIDGRNVDKDSPQEIYRKLSFRTTYRRLILRREEKEFEVILPSTQVPVNPCPLLDDASEGP